MRNQTIVNDSAKEETPEPTDNQDQADDFDLRMGVAGDSNVPTGGDSNIPYE